MANRRIELGGSLQGHYIEVKAEPIAFVMDQLAATVQGSDLIDGPVTPETVREWLRGLPFNDLSAVCFAAAGATKDVNQLGPLATSRRQPEPMSRFFRRRR